MKHLVGFCGIILGFLLTYTEQAEVKYVCYLNFFFYLISKISHQKNALVVMFTMLHYLFLCCC